MEHARFDPTLNLGQLITGIPLGLSVLALVWWQSSFQTTAETKFKEIVELKVAVDALIKQDVVGQITDTSQELMLDSNKENIDSIIGKIGDLGDKITVLNTSLQSLTAVLEDRKARTMP